MPSYSKSSLGEFRLRRVRVGHLIPGANVNFVDRLDAVLAEKAETTPQRSASPAQPGEMEVPPDLLQVVDEIGGGGRTRTYDLRIMRPSL